MKDKCRGCVMLEHECVAFVSIKESISICPCSKCIVKITCTYDDTCDDYSKFMDYLWDNPEYSKRMEDYETKVNII